MKVQRLIDFQNVEALNRGLKAEKASRERFSLEIPQVDAANAIYAAMKSEVEHRGGILQFDSDTQAHILQAAEWITNPEGKPGLLLCGMYGNGKTTLAKAIGSLISFITERELGYENRKRVRFLKAKDICRMCAASEKFKDQYDDYAALFREEMMIIDELGEEPKDVMVYGMIHTPVIDILGERYDSQRLTIITTNLDVDALKEKYGGRIYDRFTEMLTSIVFENDSYRKR